MLTGRTIVIVTVTSIQEEGSFPNFSSSQENGDSSTSLICLGTRTDQVLKIRSTRPSKDCLMNDDTEETARYLPQHLPSPSS